MKDRLSFCKYYSYHDGPCDKRGISVTHMNECQTCKKYEPRAKGYSMPNLRREKKEKFEKNMRNYM